VSKLTTSKLKELIVSKFMKEPESTDELKNRHDAYLPSGYFEKNNWRRIQKVKISSLDEQEDKLGFEAIRTGAWSTYDAEKIYEDVTFPCICRVFTCSWTGEWVEDDEKDYPDDTCLIVITDKDDKNVLMFGFHCD
jgi:hypothetical protein